MSTVPRGRLATDSWKLLQRIDLDREPPDLATSTETRARVASWLAASDIAPGTRLASDDSNTLEALERIVADDLAWTSLYGLILCWLADEGPIYGAPEKSPQVRAIAASVDIDPTTVLHVVETVVLLVEGPEQPQMAA